MPDAREEGATRDETEASEESEEQRRGRESARQVAEWEAAFAAGKAPGGASRPVNPVNRDRANAGAIVSRAHRAEKRTVRPPRRP